MSWKGRTGKGGGEGSVGEYSLIEPLGQGGMGVVWRARHRVTGELVALKRVAAPVEGALAGRHVVVTAGPTVEDLDPVRFITNRSSGKMGFAIASSAARQGARVTLIAGPVALATPHGVERVDVRSALDMQAALAQALGSDLARADALVMSAAVSDYRPRSVSARSRWSAMTGAVCWPWIGLRDTPSECAAW